MTDQENQKSEFLWKNLLRGLAWFAVLIIIFLLIEEYVRENFNSQIDSIQNTPVLLFVVFALSEIIFGIIPPEIFMMVWILDNVPLTDFVFNLALLATISYVAGVFGFYIGRNFSRTKLYQRLTSKYLKKLEGNLTIFGGLLVFIGAVTPIPFSATCMLAGSTRLPVNKFLLIATARLLRFAIYGWMVWNFSN